MTAPTAARLFPAAAVPCADQLPPPVAALSGDAYAGRACFACNKPLWSGAVYCGWARGRSGVHVLDVEVWACPRPA